MKTPENPEGWQHRREERRAPVPGLGAASFGFMTLLLAGGIAGYIYLGRDTPLAGTLPLPQAIATTSASHEDLLLLGRELNEISSELEHRSAFGGTARASALGRLRIRVHTMNDAGRALEPKLTKEEKRALRAFEEAELTMLDEIDSDTFDPERVHLARRQVAVGLKVGHGENVDQLILGNGPHHAHLPAGLDELNDVRKAKLDLSGQ